MTSEQFYDIQIDLQVFDMDVGQPSFSCTCSHEIQLQASYIDVQVIAKYVYNIQNMTTNPV